MCNFRHAILMSPGFCCWRAWRQERELLKIRNLSWNISWVSWDGEPFDSSALSPQTAGFHVGEASTRARGDNMAIWQYGGQHGWGSSTFSSEGIWYTRSEFLRRQTVLGLRAEWASFVIFYICDEMCNISLISIFKSLSDTCNLRWIHSTLQLLAKKNRRAPNDVDLR